MVGKVSLGQRKSLIFQNTVCLLHVGGCSGVLTFCSDSACRVVLSSGNRSTKLFKRNQIWSEIKLLPCGPMIASCVEESGGCIDKKLTHKTKFKMHVFWRSKMRYLSMGWYFSRGKHLDCSWGGGETSVVQTWWDLWAYLPPPHGCHPPWTVKTPWGNVTPLTCHPQTCHPPIMDVTPPAPRGAWRCDGGSEVPWPLLLFLFAFFLIQDFHRSPESAPPKSNWQIRVHKMLCF